MSNYGVQKIRTCIATYFNLYGTRPSIKEMIDWTGEEYQTVKMVLHEIEMITVVDEIAA
ncbi:MAG: hypothetical protein IKM72_05730 [Oscillospiraceae bacterium]|nr:hypothetical protein [Oscillospiraceae bacterium]